MQDGEAADFAAGQRQAAPAALPRDRDLVRGPLNGTKLNGAPINSALNGVKINGANVSSCCRPHLLLLAVLAQNAWCLAVKRIFARASPLQMH